MGETEFVLNNVLLNYYSFGSLLLFLTSMLVSGVFLFINQKIIEHKTLGNWRFLSRNIPIWLCYCYVFLSSFCGISSLDHGGFYSSRNFTHRTIYRALSRKRFSEIQSNDYDRVMDNRLVFNRLFLVFHLERFPKVLFYDTSLGL